MLVPAFRKAMLRLPSSDVNLETSPSTFTLEPLFIFAALRISSLIYVIHFFVIIKLHLTVVV